MEKGPPFYGLTNHHLTLSFIIVGGAAHMRPFAGKKVD